jgi:hypothetical protein
LRSFSGKNVWCSPLGVGLPPTKVLLYTLHFDPKKLASNFTSRLLCLCPFTPAQGLVLGRVAQCLITQNAGSLFAPIAPRHFTAGHLHAGKSTRAITANNMVEKPRRLVFRQLLAWWKKRDGSLLPVTCMEEEALTAVYLQ